MSFLRFLNIARTIRLEREAERLGIALVRQRAAVSNYAAMMERQAAPGEIANLSARLIAAEGEIETLDAGVYRASEYLGSGLAHEELKELMSLLQRQIDRNEQRRAS